MAHPPSNIEVTLSLTLEEVYSGTVKEITFQRDTIN